MGNVPGTCPYTRLIRRKSLVRAVLVYVIVRCTSQALIVAAVQHARSHPNLSKPRGLG